MAERSDNVVKLKPHSSTHTKTEVMELTTEVMAKWKAPPFQRPLRVNDKVKALAEEFRNAGAGSGECVIPGVITLGKLGKDIYLLDGQHRAHAYALSEVSRAYADVRIHVFSDLGEMGEEFVNLNSRLANLRPDDILRGLEESTPPLRSIRARCAFVGYDMVRRNERAPMVSMSALLRAWRGSSVETPSAGGASAMELGQELTQDEADTIVAVLTVLEQAWGRSPEYARLWSGLNLVLCMWLYRRLVVTAYSPNTTRFTKELFKKCMMSVSAESNYSDWLVGRRLGDHDRSPAYAKLKTIIARRYEEETKAKARLPSPAWSKSH